MSVAQKIACSAGFTKENGRIFRLHQDEIQTAESWQEAMVLALPDIELFHVTARDSLAKIAAEGLRPRSYWARDEALVGYYKETVRDEGQAPLVLRARLRDLARLMLEPDRPGLEEPISKVLGMSEDEVREAWEETDQHWLDCLCLIGSLRVADPVPVLLLSLDTEDGLTPLTSLTSVAGKNLSLLGFVGPVRYEVRARHAWRGARDPLTCVATGHGLAEAIGLMASMTGQSELVLVQEKGIEQVLYRVQENAAEAIHSPERFVSRFEDERFRALHETISTVAHPFMGMRLADAIGLAEARAKLRGEMPPKDLLAVREVIQQASKEADFNWVTGLSALDVLDAALDARDLRASSRVMGECRSGLSI